MKSEVPESRVSRGHWARDLAGVMGLLGLVLLALVAVTYDVALGRTMLDLRMNDFGRFYYSARQFLEGRDLYAQTAATLIQVSNAEWLELADLNPPHFHLLILPFSLWGPGVALAVWTVASVTSLGLSAYAVYKTLGRPVVSPLRVGILLIACAAWAGTGTLIVTGQVSLVLLWPLTLSWAAMRRGKWITSGVLVGLLTSVKPFFVLLFIPLIVRRQYRAMAAGLLASAAAVLAGLAVFGLAAHVAWIRALLRVDWPWLAMNGSVLGFFTRFFSGNPQLAPVADVPGIVRPLWLLAATSGVALTILTVVRRHLDADRGFLLLVLAMLLFSPLGWVYYAWFVVPPLIALGVGGFWGRQRSILVLACAAAFWPAPMTLIGQPSPLATVTVGSMYFWGFLSLWVAALRDSLRPNLEMLPTHGPVRP